MGVNSITLQELNPVQKDFYHILGVPRSASQEEMQQAFRKGARTFHPDVSSAPMDENTLSNRVPGARGSDLMTPNGDPSLFFVDTFNYPMRRTFSFSIQVTF